MMKLIKLVIKYKVNERLKVSDCHSETKQSVVEESL